MSRIDKTFERLKQSASGAFMPFVTAGDPSLESTAAVIETLDSAGCDLCEIGFPFSDPVADGPVIQASYNRALGAGVRVQDIFAMLRSVSSRVAMPLVGMVSHTIVYRIGIETFSQQAAGAGLAGLIVPDLPWHESLALVNATRAVGIDLIQLITPTTSPERAKQICAVSGGFIYYVSVAGVTGERRALPTELAGSLRWLKTVTSLPVCVGFGISEPAQAAQLRGIADGVIVGSAIVRRMENLSGRFEEDEIPLQDLANWCREFVQVCHQGPEHC